MQISTETTKEIHKLRRAGLKYREIRENSWNVMKLSAKVTRKFQNLEFFQKNVGKTGT